MTGDCNARATGGGKGPADRFHELAFRRQLAAAEAVQTGLKNLAYCEGQDLIVEVSLGGERIRPVAGAPSGIDRRRYSDASPVPAPGVATLQLPTAGR
jgi:hypothetical protein